MIRAASPQLRIALLFVHLELGGNKTQWKIFFWWKHSFKILQIQLWIHCLLNGKIKRVCLCKRLVVATKKRINLLLEIASDWTKTMLAEAYLVTIYTEKKPNQVTAVNTSGHSRELATIGKATKTLHKVILYILWTLDVCNSIVSLVKWLFNQWINAIVSMEMHSETEHVIRSNSFIESQKDETIPSQDSKWAPIPCVKVWLTGVVIPRCIVLTSNMLEIFVVNQGCSLVICLHFDGKGREYSFRIYS